jgi:hypothetical protein
MARKRVRFTYPEVLIQEPIIYLLGHEFQVVTNIRMAAVEQKTAWVMVELEGESAEITRALDWAEAKGVRIDPVEGDVVE